MLLEEVLQQIVAALGEDRFRMELHPSTASVRWRRPMISPSSVHAVISRQAGRDLARSTASEW
jgi:hypothetical protein